MMYDSRAEGRKWNISFYDYSSNLGGIEVNPEYSKFLLDLKNKWTEMIKVGT